MPRIQPRIEEIRIVSAGSRLCWIALPMKSHVQRRHQAGVVAAGRREEAAGRPASSAIAIRPSQKYGTDGQERGDRQQRVDPGAAPPAGQTPSAVPSRKLMMVVMPTRASVHGSACRDHLGDRRREERERQPEVAVEQLAPVVDVLLPERRVLVQAEQHVQRVDRVGADAGPGAGDQRAAPGRPGSAAG